MTGSGICGNTKLVDFSSSTAVYKYEYSLFLLLSSRQSVYFWLSSATPGSVCKIIRKFLVQIDLENALTLPSRSSREAPPPVDTWLSFDSAWYWATTVAVSPPPTMTVAPFCAASMVASRRACEPAAKAGNSKTPGGLYTESQHSTLHASTRCLPVPEDGAGLEDSCLEELAGLGTSIKTHPARWDTLSVGGDTSLGILVELVGRNEVNGEDDLDVVLLCLLNESVDLLGTSLVVEGVSNLEDRNR